MTHTTNISLKDQIYSALLNQIILGEFTPDDVINEKRLIEKYQVSRAPIREALIALCNENVLYSIPYVGYKVTPLSSTDIEHARAYRCVLECGFMRENWHMFTEENIQKLVEVNDVQYSAPEERDALTHWENNIIFHQTFFEIYDNPIAIADLRSVMSLQTRAYAQTRWNEVHRYKYIETPAFHGLIIKAIRKNDCEEAISLLRADIISI